MKTTNTTNEEKRFSTNFACAINWLHNDFVMCNKLPEIDPSIWDNMRGDIYDEETDEYTEIYQYFITSASDEDIDFLMAHFSGLLFTYSELLDSNVMCVTHWGTGWDYVTVETDLKSAARNLGEK